MKKRALFSSLLVAASLCMSQNAFAQKPEDNRPPLQEVFQNEVVYSQEKGEVQITTGLNLNRNLRHGFGQIPLSVEYGITDKWQVGLEWNALTSSSIDGSKRFGTGDMSISAMRSFMNVRDSNTHVAVGFELGVPSGDISKAMSEGLLEYEPFVVAARDFPELKNLQVFAQVGVSFVRRIRHEILIEDEEPAAHELNWGTGFFIPFGPGCFTTEFNWKTNRWNNGGRYHERTLTPGVVVRLPYNHEIGFASPIGLGGDSTDPRFIIKFTREF